MAWSGGTFTRTNGVNTGATTWATDAAAGVKIRADRHDTHDQDLATGINQCINKDGSNTATQLNVDNLRLDGNTISSTNTNGNIELSPNGTGLVNIAAAGDLAIAGTAITSTATQINNATATTATTAELNTLAGSTSGSYTGTATGLTTSPTVTVNYKRVGNMVFVETRSSLTGTSNASTFTITGAPAGITPASATGEGIVQVYDNGTGQAGTVFMENTGALTFGRVSDAAFTTSGTKGVGGFTFSYMVSV